MIIGYIKGQELEIIQNTIVSDSIDYLTAEFNFSTNEWDGFIKWAHFKKDDIVYDVLLADDKILKSQHLNLSAGVWEVYVHGNKSGGTERITTNIVKLTVEPTGALNGEPLPEIPLEVAEQIMATIGSLDNLETTEKSNIVAAINEAVKTGGSSVQSDYEQNDSSQPDYIKNRTHYKEIIHQEKVDLLPATEIDFSSLGDRGYSQPEPLNIQVGDKVKVLWGSQEYECVAQSTATLDPEGRIGLPADGIAFGNLYYLFEVTDDSRNMPFCAIANYTMSKQGEIIPGCNIMLTSELTNPITVNIFTEEDKVVYHKLDVNYLNLSSSVSQNDNNPVTSGAVYEAIQAAVGNALGGSY